MARILVVDDDAVNVTIAQTVLTHAGHQVVAASSGAECIRIAQEQQPELVLTDVQMPDMDGREVLRRLRAEPRTATLKVIAVTGLSARADAEMLLAQGFNGYVAKPLSYKALLAEIARLLD